MTNLDTADLSALAGNLFEERYHRKPDEMVDERFLRTSSLSPLHYLIRHEEQKELRRTGAQLQQLARDHLAMGEYVFLVELFGPDFGHKLRMPLEFRDLTRTEFEDYFRANLPKFQSRLAMLMESVDWSPANPMNGKAGALKAEASNPYLLTSAEELVRIYESVRAGMRDYPPGFFTPTNRRVSRVLTRHMFDAVLGTPQEKIVPNLSRNTFEDNRLGIMLDLCYSSSPMQAVLDAYPASRYPAVHRPVYRPDDPVTAILKDLEAF